MREIDKRAITLVESHEGLEVLADARVHDELLTFHFVLSYSTLCDALKLHMDSDRIRLRNATCGQ